MTADLSGVVETYSKQILEAYRAQPRLVDEHAGLEENIAQGGYGRRQIHELVQNGADELIKNPGGRIEVVLTSEHLYCANEGSAITEDGVGAILLAHVSPKRGNEIGRFGLGFKSVLGVSDRPQVFSDAVSFGFDSEWAATEIAATAGDRESYPTLRVARLLDRSAERAADPVLDELLGWATTVIRLPITLPCGWLSDDISGFEPEFLLFSPHVGCLVLEDRSNGVRRSITMEADGEDLVLSEDERTQRWRVFRTDVEPSDEARQSAGKLQHRDRLPLVWAVPMDGKLEVGRFWAFFPLRDQTTLSGVVNAPWQVNDDRTGLLEHSRLNKELLHALVRLVFESLPSLVAPDDPGRVLDLVPARGREARCWGDEELTAVFHSLRSRERIVPNQAGVLREIGQVLVPPESIPVEAQTAWAAQPGRPEGWIHPTALTTPTRRQRVRALLEQNRLSFSPANEWLEALVGDDATATESAGAIGVASIVARSAGGIPEDLRASHVVLNDGGEWSRLHPEWVWILPEDLGRDSHVVVVHPDVVALPDVREQLHAVGLKDVTPELELEALLSEAGVDGDSWEAIWELSSEVEEADRVAAVLRHYRKTVGPFLVRVASGTWRPCVEVLLPGRVVEPGTGEGESVMVDPDFHARHLEILRLAGMSDGPAASGDIESDPLAQRWRREVIDAYAERLADAGSNPQRKLLVVDNDRTPLPLSVLPHMAGDVCARYVELLAEVPGAMDTRHTFHSSAPRYPKEPCDSPAVWAIRKWGRLATSLTPADASSSARAVSYCVGPSLSRLAGALPVAAISERAAEALGLPSCLDDIPTQLWEWSFDAKVDRTPEELGTLFSAAVEAQVGPFKSVWSDASLSVTEVVVTTTQEDVAALEEIGRTVAVVESASTADILVKDWGLKPAQEFFSVAVVPVGASEGVAVTDRFPALAALDPKLADLEIVPCEQILVERSSDEGKISKEVASQIEDGVFYVVAGSSDDERILDELVDAKGWVLTEDERRQTIESKRTAQGLGLAKKIRAAKSITKKIELAIGAPQLVRLLPKTLIEEMTARSKGKLTDPQIAELALAVHGVEILTVHRDDLAANGLDTPGNWAGGGSARRFVLDLGFPEEFAGFQSEARDALMSVPGPPEMPELHDFQRTAADHIRDLVRAGKGRGLLSLPTGAGKTRTAVQALIESMREGELEGPILWVAQTDELCEQAVSAWSDNWRAIGPRRTLKLSRLWSNREAQDLRDRDQVLVATVAKLGIVVDKEEYDWLKKANAVVIDEAHRAISPEYTKLLEWLGMGRGKERAPVIGLSATPFRGVSETQTKALVNRFNGNRLDDMGDQPYEQLQEMGVLANVEHRLLAGADVQLDAEELKTLQATRRLPPAVLERIGQDEGRNQTILDSVESLPKDHTVLLFAASVDHAEVMAGLLSVRGIPSRAISAKTKKGARHHYIEQFRAGEIRVLTNFGVLTEGFDAPAVRAVYVARPTYSPNVYQQMIGRGLRGPLNGGKEVCLIVNVADNMAQFGEALAFHEYEYLWDGK